MSVPAHGVERVVVVGGGAMGSASAWRLALRGYRVTLLEQFWPGHVRGASHGSSRNFRHAYPDRRYVDLAARAADLWTELEKADGTRLLTWTGAVDHGDPAAVQALATVLATTDIAHQILSPRSASQRWPGLSFDTVVLHHRAAGRVDADRAVAALQRQAVAAGADVLHETPVRTIRAGTRSVELVLDSGTVHADHVVIAAGAWSADLLRGLVDLPLLRTTREQPAHFDPLDNSTFWPSFIHHPGSNLCGEGIYGLGSPDGVKIGEHGTGPQVHPDRRTFEPDPAATHRLIAYAQRWLPGVDPLSARPVTCLYTTTPDGSFVIDRVGRLTVAAGFSGHGFKFTPAVGELVARLVEGEISAPHLFSKNRDRVDPTGTPAAGRVSTSMSFSQS